MQVVGAAIRMLAKGFDSTGSLFQRIGFLLSNFLPAVLSQSELTAWIRSHYDKSYEQAMDHFTADVYEWTLETWEEAVLGRYGISDGRMLVLGAGVGREAVALAQRGLHVIGIDINGVALRIATRTAQARQVPARFVQADFLCLPFTGSPFRYAIMSGIMYSAIAGRCRRQAWLAQFAHHLAPEGLVILQFLTDRFPPSRTQRISDAINRIVATLPGGNSSYETGDRCAQGHFLHAFQKEADIQKELQEAGVHIDELNWRQSFAVISFPQADSESPCASPDRFSSAK